MTVEYDDDGQPMEAGERLAEAERAMFWKTVNHAPERAHLADRSCDGLHS